MILHIIVIYNTDIQIVVGNKHSDEWRNGSDHRAYIIYIIIEINFRYIAIRNASYNKKSKSN